MSTLPEDAPAMTPNVSSLEHEITAQDKVFFLHIPKTAGTAFAAILEHHFHPSEIFPCYPPSQLAGISKQNLANYRYIRGHFHYEAIRSLWHPAPVTITLLRDPMERFLSHFAQTQRGKNDLPEALVAKLERMTIDDLMNEERILFSLSYLNCQATLLGATQPAEVTKATELLPLLKVLNHTPKSDHTVTRAKELLDTFAVVGLSERFQDSLHLLAYTFGWQPVRDIQELNTTPKRLRQQEMSPATLERIAALNTLDIELYRHVQTVFEARFSQMTHALLENYGTRDQAHLPYPLPEETLRELLDKHYEHRAAKRYASQSRPALQFKFDQAFEGVNWHLLEISPDHGATWWSGPGTTASLDFPLARESDLIIKFRILMALAPDILESLKLTVNDQPIPLTQHPDRAGGIIFQGHIPQATLQQRPSFTRLTFEVNRTLMPYQVDAQNPDKRRLGVMFNWIDIFPAAWLQNDRLPDDSLFHALIAQHPHWYHRIQVAPGIVTPGSHDSQAMLAHLDHLGLPQEAAGLRVLDIGCRDGFFSFELEKRGAEVIGIDYLSPTQTGFAIASELLQSRVDYLTENVYALSPEKHGTFDLVLFLGVLYHLRHPLLALDKIHSVCKPGALMFVETQLLDNRLLLDSGAMTSLAAVAPGLENTPLMQFYPNQTLLNDPTNKWAPNMSCLRQMLEDAQFEIVTSRLYPARGYCVTRAIFEDNYYQELDSGRQRPAQSFQINFEQPPLGSGWHTPTLTEHGTACWTGPETHSTLTVPVVTDGDLTIRFHILMALAPDVLDSLKLTVNEQPIELSHHRDPAGTTIFEGYLPPTLFKPGASLARLAFDVNRTLIPHQIDPHNPDERRLGVLFNWIEIQPPQKKPLIGSPFLRLRRLATRLSGLKSTAE